MCMAECNFTDAEAFKPGPNYCPRHPSFDMGARSISYYRGYIYQRRCDYCIVDTVKSLLDPKDKTVEYFKTACGITLDPVTIQTVLDVLDQKLGLYEWIAPSTKS